MICLIMISSLNTLGQKYKQIYPMRWNTETDTREHEYALSLHTAETFYTKKNKRASNNLFLYQKLTETENIRKYMYVI